MSQWEACGPDLEEARAETSAEGCGYFGIEGPETTGSAQEVLTWPVWCMAVFQLPGLFKRKLIGNGILDGSRL